MAENHLRADKELAQPILLDDPQFLRKIVEQALQQILEAQMTAHIGALLPTSAPRSARAIATATSPAHLRLVWARWNC